jgi:hypothetical protein
MSGDGRTPRKCRAQAAVVAPVAIIALFACSAFGRQATTGIELSAVTDIACRFPLMAVGNWTDDVPRAELRDASLVLEFEAINTDEGTAQMASDFGTFDIIVRYADGYLHFIQSFLDGPLHSTTVLEETTAQGNWKAMHSRHEFTEFALPGFTSSPEQYYGECAPAEGSVPRPNPAP